MARFEKSSHEAPEAECCGSGAARASSDAAPSIEDTMFFPRLRRHAKWMFVFSRSLFGLGFVALRRRRGRRRASATSSAAAAAASASRSRRAREDRGEPEERRGVARALDRAADRGRDRRGDRARSEQAVALRPKDADAYRELAGLHLAQATKRQQEAQLAQVRRRLPARRRRHFPAASASPSGQAGRSTTRSGSAINAQASADASRARYQEAQTAATGSPSTRTRARRSSQPDDPNVQLELAQAAQQTGDAATAIAAYERFLEARAGRSERADRQQQLKQLRRAAASSSG